MVRISRQAKIPGIVRIRVKAQKYFQSRGIRDLLKNWLSADYDVGIHPDWGLRRSESLVMIYLIFKSESGPIAPTDIERIPR